MRKNRCSLLPKIIFYKYLLLQRLRYQDVSWCFHVKCFQSYVKIAELHEAHIHPPTHLCYAVRKHHQLTEFRDKLNLTQSLITPGINALMISSLMFLFNYCILELKNAPVLQNVIAKGSRSLQLQWITPSTDNYTGSILSYQIWYQKSSGQTNCRMVSVSSNLTQAVISSLHPFQGYKVKIRGVVALGYGPYSNLITSTTHEASNKRY